MDKNNQIPEVGVVIKVPEGADISWTKGIVGDGYQIERTPMPQKYNLEKIFKEMNSALKLAKNLFDDLLLEQNKEGKEEKFNLFLLQIKSVTARFLANKEYEELIKVNNINNKQLPEILKQWCRNQSNGRYLEVLKEIRDRVKSAERIPIYTVDTKLSGENITDHCFYIASGEKFEINSFCEGCIELSQKFIDHLRCSVLLIDIS